ncbi:MAG: methyltransferase domain-containing protein [Actinobacteria bacterium]|nr:methyltransferase domain-containing protein [Actinomycetota bacterium]
MDDPRDYIGGLYDRHYYESYTEDAEKYGYIEPWLSFFGSIADYIAEDIKPATVMDVGCGFGILVKALRERDIQAFGIDISEYAMSQVDAEIREYCQLGSITDSLPQAYDLIVCIEVVEHLPPKEALSAVTNICRHTEDVIFSSTSDGFREPTHLNVRPMEYWAELFARNGFYRDLDFDEMVIGPHAMRFQKIDLPKHKLVAAYERRLSRRETESREVRKALLDMRARNHALQEMLTPLDLRVLARRAIRATWRSIFRRR